MPEQPPIAVTALRDHDTDITAGFPGTIRVIR
jgi:hypothetical protein